LNITLNQEKRMQILAMQHFCHVSGGSTITTLESLMRMPQAELIK